MTFRRSFLLMFSGFALSSTVAVVAQNIAPRPVNPAIAAVSAKGLDEYVGQYRAAVEPDAVDSVYYEGGSLFFEGERWPRTELKAESTDHFVVTGSPVRVEFVRDADGKVSGLKMNFGAGGRGAGERQMERFSTEGVRLNQFRDYVKSEAMVPMRDGAKLHVVILRPAGSENSGPALPFLFERTPYGTDNN